MNTQIIGEFERIHCMNWCKHQFRNWEPVHGALLQWLGERGADEQAYALEQGWPSVWRIVSMERPEIFEASFE